MEINHLFKKNILLAITILLFSCVNLKNPKERNRLVFNDCITSVIDSVNAINEILLKSKKEIYTYGIDVDMNNPDRNENVLFLYIDDNSNTVYNAGKITDSLLYKNKALEFIDSSDRKRFISIVLFLNKNYLSGCRSENGKLIYFYRANIYMADRQTDLDRFVVIENSKQGLNLNRYKILDEFKNLYLLANKDAKIWCKN